MVIQIDVKKLLSTLKQFNSDADLTGVKAYLLDLIVGYEMEYDQPRRKEELVRPSEILEEPQEDILSKVMSTPAPALKNGPPKKVLLNSKEARESRRKKAEEYANMSTKELLDSLVNKDMEKKRGENNQFVNEGTDTYSDDGEMEIG